MPFDAVTVSKCKRFYILKNMYTVIQFSASEGGTVSLAKDTWLTPRKTEVYWPPTKQSKSFNKLLEDNASPDTKNWKLYGVQRVFYETVLEKETGLLADIVTNNPSQSHLKPWDSTPASPSGIGKLTAYQSKVLSLLSIIRTQNEQLINMLNRSSKGATQLKPEFIFPLPNEEDVVNTEALLINKDHYDNLVSLGVVSIAAIQIPQSSENTHTITKTVPIITKEQIQPLPIYYVSDYNVDSYLAPPDPHKPQEVIRDAVPTPATYLLPPSPDKQNEYFVNPSEPGEQTEWHPIAAQQQDLIPLIQQEIWLNPNEVKANLRTGKVLHSGQVITVPSRNLLPPRENAGNDFVILSPSPELELPLEEIDHTQNHKVNVELPGFRPPLAKPSHVFRVNPESLPVPYITPPGNVPQVYKNPTRLYPKKYINEFKPIPIPISQYEEESENATSTITPDFQNTAIHHNSKQLAHSKEKNKRKQPKEAAKPEPASDDANEEENPAEQEVSESNHRHHGNHIHTHPRKEPFKHKPEHKSKGERTEFRMHGMKGPHSYQFGYDTGKGKNRQFRYEERDNDGHVRGHYGYVDKSGKLRVVNYDADPQLGFRAEAPVVTD